MLTNKFYIGMYANNSYCREMAYFRVDLLIRCLICDSSRARARSLKRVTNFEKATQRVCVPGLRDAGPGPGVLRVLLRLRGRGRGGRAALHRARPA